MHACYQCINHTHAGPRNSPSMKCSLLRSKVEF